MDTWQPTTRQRQNQQAPSESGNTPQDTPNGFPGDSKSIKPREQPQQQNKVLPLLTRLPGSWRYWRWLVAGALVLALLIVIVMPRAAAPAVPHRVSADTMSFPISGQPTLIFAHATGNVHITRGDDSQVRIKEHRNGFADAIQVQYQQKGNVITTRVDIPNDLMEDTWVDFDVSIPSQAGVIASLENGGTLEADGLSGHFTLSNTNGSIWATNLSGPVTLKTESGSINLKHVVGPMTLITQNGTITTDTVRARGHTLIQAESGTINFHGSLDPQGNYLFKNGNGAIGVTLLPGAAFHVRATNTGGSIASDFSTVTIQNKNGTSEAQGNVGTPPLARLSIQTTGGQINLFRGT